MLNGKQQQNTQEKSGYIDSDLFKKKLLETLKINDKSRTTNIQNKTLNDYLNTFVDERMLSSIFSEKNVIDLNTDKTYNYALNAITNYYEKQTGKIYNNRIPVKLLLKFVDENSKTLGKQSKEQVNDYNKKQAEKKQQIINKLQQQNEQQKQKINAQKQQVEKQKQRPQEQAKNSQQEKVFSKETIKQLQKKSIMQSGTPEKSPIPSQQQLQQSDGQYENNIELQINEKKGEINKLCNQNVFNKVVNQMFGFTLSKEDVQYYETMFDGTDEQVLNKINNKISLINGKGADKKGADIVVSNAQYAWSAKRPDYLILLDLRSLYEQKIAKEKEKELQQQLEKQKLINIQQQNEVLEQQLQKQEEINKQLQQSQQTQSQKIESLEKEVKSLKDEEEQYKAHIKSLQYIKFSNESKINEFEKKQKITTEKNNKIKQENETLKQKKEN